MGNLIDRYISLSFDDALYSEGKVREFIFNYSRFFPEFINAPILDVGPGRGEMLIALSRNGFNNVNAIDISSEVIARCRGLARRVILVDDPIGLLEKKEDRYCLITVLDVLEHFEKKNIIRFLEVLRGNLAEDGKLIIQVPNMGAIFPSLHRYNDFTHEVCFNDHSLRQVLLAAGFGKIELFPFEHFVRSTWKCNLGKFMRDKILFPSVRMIRMIDGSLNPEILSPVFFAVARQ